MVCLLSVRVFNYIVYVTNVEKLVSQLLQNACINKAICFYSVVMFLFLLGYSQFDLNNLMHNNLPFKCKFQLIGSLTAILKSNVLGSIGTMTTSIGNEVQQLAAWALDPMVTTLLEKV